MATSTSHYDALSAVAGERMPSVAHSSFSIQQDATMSSWSTRSVSELSRQEWTHHLRAPRAQTQFRAWSRVEIASHRARNFARTVRKRIGLPLPRPIGPAVPMKPVKIVPVKGPLLSEDGLPVRRVIRRLASYKASSEECLVKGIPFSRLDMVRLQMQAKADVAQSLRGFPTAITRDQVRQRQAGCYVQTVPLKRRRATIPSAGNRIGTYTEILFLVNTIPHFRVPSQPPSLLLLPRQPPSSPTRCHTAVLNPYIEPVTPAAVMEPPRRICDAKSPTKKSPRHRSPPMKNDGPRISDPAVKLLPSTTPRIEPSPTKSASPPPATPLREMRRRHTRGTTPSSFPRVAPIGAAFSKMLRHSALRSNSSPLRLPAAAMAATPCPPPQAVETLKQLLSVNSASPAIQTPSRARTVEPATPGYFADFNSLTADVPSPVTFVPNLFPGSPEKASAPLESGTPQKSDNFDFGTISPSFNSVTWLAKASSGTPRSSCKKASRRQSEPLVRLLFKSRDRRQSVSPQKLVFQGEQTFAGSEGLLSPVKNIVLTAASAADAESPLPSPQKPQQLGRGLGREMFPALQPAMNGTVNIIDMRQNPDIFATRASSLSVSSVLSTALPDIAESRSEIEESRPQISPPVVEQRSSALASAYQYPRTSLRSLVEELDFGGLGLLESRSAAAERQAISADESEEDADITMVKRSPLLPKDSATSQQGPSLSPSPTLESTDKPADAGSPSSVDTAFLQETCIPESSKTATTETIETVAAQSHDYDSPGRDYMREFIRRSRPKRPSATEAGSPIAQTAKRQALGAKSPNAQSPSPNKRRREKDLDEDTAIEKLAASPKKMRRGGHTPSKKSPSKKSSATRKNSEDIQSSLDVPTVNSTDDGEEQAELDDGASRRSSRLRSQGRLPAAKSALPTPIKIGRNSGPLLNSAVRNEQQTLTNQTRMNTRSNKGNAEYPAQFLAKKSEEVRPELELEQHGSSSPDSDARKCVNWSNPLAVYQQEQEDVEGEKSKGKKGKSVTRPKSVKMSGIAKPATRAKTTADKERTARLAEHFGMVSNGTPAKPTRATRSRMRI